MDRETIMDMEPIRLERKSPVLGKAQLALYRDIMCVVKDCMLCTKDRCTDYCYQFTQAQVEEIAEKADPGSYERIYIYPDAYKDKCL